jgi:hypothetical protein
MKHFQLLILTLCCLMLNHQTARADDPNTIVFQETFDKTNGTGGRDGKFTGNIASSNITYDNSSCTASSCGGANLCLKFGTSSNNGVLTTPTISLGGASHALLTFSAAGWGDTKKNTLAITANDGFTLSGDNTILELGNEEWNEYTVLITVTSGTDLQLTFTGKRGFLDDIVVRAITTVPAPTLTDGFTFFPNTSEVTASKSVMLTPVNYTVAYYTTDGTIPTKTNGIEATLTTPVAIHGTTTVKAVAYVGDMQSQVVTKTYTQGPTVSSIADFRNLSDNAETRIFFNDDENHEARVLYYDESSHQLFLRDKTEALCIDLGETATFNPTPQYNQHVAGWIAGKKVDNNGMLKLVATANTSTDYLAIADPITEAQTEPNAISIGDINSHMADWVTISEQRIGDDLAVTDRFGTGSYEGALIDVSGIVIPDGGTAQIAPISQNGIPAVVYVIDEDQTFTSPATDIANTTVRLKRTLSKDHWNTFVAPFDIVDWDANIREYDNVEGKTMLFKDATSIEAGKPYLVKPNTEDIINPMFNNVTLTAVPQTTITIGDYSFVATYSPKLLATDHSELFLTTAGKLAYPASDVTRTIKGMRAYLKVPANANASIFIEGESNLTGIADVRCKTEDAKEFHDLQGRKVARPAKGLYIVNGKKIIIH